MARKLLYGLFSFLNTQDKNFDEINMSNSKHIEIIDIVNYDIYYFVIEFKNIIAED